MPSVPQAAFTHAETEKWVALAKKAGIKAE
jgi:hypothetical protein